MLFPEKIRSKNMRSLFDLIEIASVAFDRFVRNVLIYDSVNRLSRETTWTRVANDISIRCGCRYYTSSRRNVIDEII